MIVSAIAAMARNRAIGYQNRIPWYLPADLKYFKRTTMNHHIIMGRKSFQSIGKPLPKRTNIVITRDPFFVASNVLIARSVEEALEMAFDNGEEEAFIIGGGQIYEQSLPYWDRLYLTVVDIEVKGDVFFPAIEDDEWKLVSEEKHRADQNNEWDYAFRVYERRHKSEE